MLKRWVWSGVKGCICGRYRQGLSKDCMVGNIGKEEGDVGVDTASQDVHIFN